jgi:hypothetical protein
VVGVVLTPVPESATVCGELVALSEMLRFAVRDPVVEGVNVTEIVQDADTASVEQVFVSAKFEALVPVIETVIPVRLAPPGFDIVTVIGELVTDTTVLGNETLEGENETSAPPSW